MDKTTSIIDKLLNLAELEISGNYVHKYFLAIAAFAISFFIIKLISRIGIKQLKKFAEKTKIQWDDILISLISKNSTWFSLVIALYIGTAFIKLTPGIQKIILSISVILITFIFVRMAQGFLIFYFEQEYFKDKDEAGKISIMRNMLLLLRSLLWLGGALFVLDNLGFDITTAVAGLGIGGMALALASQNILSDIFSYFTIFFDKPFEVGDFIVVNGNSGTIQHIGIKTTRMKSLQGEQLVYGNSDLIKSCIQNFKKMQNRRISTTIGVTYETSPDKLKKVPELIKQIVSNKENIKFDRVHFKSFGDFSLNFEFVYNVLTPDYGDFMNVQQEINYALYDTFSQEGIDFAYPTQTLFVNQTVET